MSGKDKKDKKDKKGKDDKKDKKDKKGKDDKKDKKDKKGKDDKKDKKDDKHDKKDDKHDKKDDKKDKKKKLSKKEKKALKSQKKTKVADMTKSFGTFDANIVRQCQESKKTNPNGHAMLPTAAGTSKHAQPPIPGAEWSVAGKAEGVQVWRIMKFNVVPIPKEEYGEFYQGDSYIILRTRKVGNSFKWDIHFWLGEDSTQDEYGTAAYKTVELDDLLGGTPVQHREVQGYESELFLSYFPFLTILEGGEESGFRHVGDKSYKPRLLQFKGKKNIRVEEVDLEADSLNSGDVFILDKGLTIWVWQGAKSNPQERLKAGEVSRGIRDNREASAKIVVISEGDNDAEFWAAIGGQGPISSAEEGGDDLEHESANSASRRLCKLSDATGTLQFTEVSAGNEVKRSQLTTADAFIFDSGSEVFAWVGAKASDAERKNALAYAQMYLSKYNRPSYMPISRIFENGENEVFEAFLAK